VFEVGEEHLVIRGRRSCVSVDFLRATVVACVASGAIALAITTVLRPRKLPISTIWPPERTDDAASYNCRAWPSVIQPATPSTAANACSNVRRLTGARSHAQAT
jgi:hypothetical protein